MELLKTKKPDIVCFEEAILDDVKNISIELGYEFSFAPLVIIKNRDEKKEEGSAILSKFPILKTNKYRYDGQTSPDVPIIDEEKISSGTNGERPRDRFLYHSTLLTISLQGDNDTVLTIATTHFPVVDHTTRNLKDHNLDDIQKITEMEQTRAYLDRLIPLLRSIQHPMIFTADLNNTRGEYIYDTVAHELVDIVPLSVPSTIDPELHRRGHNLELLVDTIMTSPDITVNNFEIMQGASDHKALFASIVI
ncbi:MAG: endonuclease/exonuclease/phosphatase family protein [Candidatus Pacebacteria bacterium]|nr:endonuclease/exonuclease/phosphatase family protein [Candidatus Paceibacterota bacterium]